MAKSVTVSRYKAGESVMMIQLSRQELLKAAAILYAKHRAERGGHACYVYASGDKWYVRTEEEGKPGGSTLIQKTGE
jgi:hypothetical protein